ncbi:MAG: hypothetical protein ABI560_15910 [Myxococcales bacterium]
MKFTLAGLLTLALLLVLLAWFSTDRFATFGGSPDVDRLPVSQHFVDGQFHSLEPTSMLAPNRWLWAVREWLFGKEMRSPICALPVVTDAPMHWSAPPSSGLRVTWLGLRFRRQVLRVAQLIEYGGR